MRGDGTHRVVGRGPRHGRSARLARVVFAIVVASGTDACGVRISREEPGCIDAEFVGCTVTESGEPAAVTCFNGAVTQVVSCAEVCGIDVESCTLRYGVTSPADVCDCPPCAQHDDCAANAFCAPNGVGASCRKSATGPWRVDSVDVEVPRAGADGVDWDDNGLPDVVVEITLDDNVWFSSPPVDDTLHVAVLGAADAVRELRGDEVLGIFVYDLDGNGNRTFIDGGEFARLGGLLDARGYTGRLVSPDPVTTVSLELSPVTEEP